MSPQDVAHERHLGEVIERKQVGAQPVIDVMGVIGDVIGDGGDLRLGAGEARQFEVLGLAVDADRMRHAALAITPDRVAVAIGERTVVLDQPFERFPRQVEPDEGGIAPLERGDDAQRLRVVIEAAAGSQAVVERALAGMAERRMAEVMGERERFGEVFVEPERAGERAGDLGDFERMGEAGAEMIALVEDKDLGLVREPAECGAMDDSVTVAAERVAGGRRRLRMEPAAAPARLGRIGRARSAASTAMLRISPIDQCLDRT